MKLHAQFELPTFASVLLAAELIQGMSDVKWRRDERLDALQAEYQTRKRQARYTMDLRDGKLNVLFEGARRSLVEGSQRIQLLCGESKPWEKPQCSVALTLIGHPCELTVWGTVLSAESSSRKPLF